MIRQHDLITLKGRGQVDVFLSKIGKGEGAFQIGIVQTKLIQTHLAKKYKKNILWMTPESFDYKLRFRTDDVLTCSKVWVIGTNILRDQKRGAKFKFSLLRIKLYNPAVEIKLVEILNEDWLYEILFSQRLSSYNNSPINEDKKLTKFLIVKSRKDIVYWHHYLKKFKHHLVACSSVPNHVTKEILTFASKRKLSVILTKDLAFKHAKFADKLVVLPSFDDHEEREKSFGILDMCVVLVFEGRINNRIALAKILTKYYNFTDQCVKKAIDDLISSKVITELASGVIVPTFVGKTIVRSFLSVETLKQILKAKDSITKEVDILDLLDSLSEFSRERTLENVLRRFDSMPSVLKNTLEFEINNRKIWLLRGIASIFSTLRHKRLARLTRSIIKNLQNRRKFLLAGIINTTKECDSVD